MLLCLVFPVRFCVDVYCLVFNRTYVHFYCFLFLYLHRFVDLIFVVDYTIRMFFRHYFACGWFIFFPFLMLLFLLFTFTNLGKCFQLQYHLKHLIHYYHPFDIVGRWSYRSLKTTFCKLGLQRFLRNLPLAVLNDFWEFISLKVFK